MSIHAVDKNLYIENVIVDYRDRTSGSTSKLNTYSDGKKVIKTIIKSREKQMYLDEYQ